MSATYGFTNEQLTSLLYGTIGMFIEYRDVHGKTEENARFSAVGEMFEGLDAEIDLAKEGEVAKLTLSMGEVITVTDHDRVLDQMNGIVKQTRQERDGHKVAVQELLIACRDLLAHSVNTRIDWESSNFKTVKQARKHVESHPLGIESAARNAIGKYLNTYPAIDVSLVENAPELRDALKALRDWCDENINGVPLVYGQIMEQADAALNRVDQKSDHESHGESVDVRLTALRSIDDAYLNAVLDWIAGALKRHEAVSESLTAVRLVRHLANLFPMHRESVDGLAMEQRAGRVNG